MTIGLGWDPNEGTGYDFDLDASAFMIDRNHLIPTEGFFVFYGNTDSPDGALRHTGGNSEGGDDESIDREVAKSTPEQKGDWKPLVFIMTDGSPTDDWQSGLAELKTKKTGIVVACAAGADADTDVLKQITDDVVSLDTADSATIKAFFKWMSASISTGNQKVEGDFKDVAGLNELPPLPEVNIVV